MPRKSNLRFTPEEEKEIVTYALARKQSLLNDEATQRRITNDREAWARYWLEVEERKNKSGSIFALSNVPLPVFAMTVDHFVSRIEDATTGEEPYFHFQAVGRTDEEKALLFNRYFDWKLNAQGKVHDALQDAQLGAFIQSASIQKATFDRKVARWVDREKRILYSRTTNAPVEFLRGDAPDIIVEEEDEWVEQLDPVQPTMLDRVVQFAGGDAPEPVLRKHLAADPSIVLDDGEDGEHEWRLPPEGLERSEVLYAGPKSENIPSDRFLCPMDAESVDAADTVIELQDKTYDWFRENWLERPWKRWADYEAQFATGNADPKTNQTGQEPGTPSPEQPENRAWDSVNPVRKVLECWIRRDIHGKGRGSPQEFVCWVDELAQCLVYYEWQAKVSPDMRRPYTVTAIAKVKNRWYGKSIWERAKHIFEAIDRMFNGEFYRTLQHANPPKGGDPTVAEEEPEEIGFDPTKYWKLKQGKTIDELLSYAKVPDTNQRTQQVLEYLIFWIQLWLGISNLAQGDYSALPQNNTKYGIQKTLAEASMLGRRFIRRVIAADEEHLTKLVMIAIATLPQNQQEVFEFTEDDKRQIAELNSTELRSLTVNVTVILSQHHEEQDIERCRAALEIQKEYVMQLTPEVRAAMRPLMIEMLTDLGFKDPENLLPLFMATPMTPAMMGGEPTKNGALPSASPAPTEAPTPEATQPPAEENPAA